MQKTKPYLGYIFIVSFVAALGIFLFQMNKKESAVMSIEPPAIAAVASPEPTAIPSQISPDGSSTVSLKTIGNTTEIMVNDEVVATRPNESSPHLLIPFNTWSPDDKYFFLEAKGEVDSEYFVYTSSGKSYADGAPYLMVRDLFAQAHPESAIVDVTGWAAPALLIINAKSHNEAKMSFWFEVTSRKFIRLSNYFY